MRRSWRLSALVVLLGAAAAMRQGVSVDLAMVAKIREEGLQRSQVMEFEGYLADILGARLTLSEDMKRAQ
jgi:hypothetical protein